MQLIVNNVEITREMFKLSMEVVSTGEEFEKLSFGGYEQRNFVDSVREKIAQVIANEYLEKYKMKLINELKRDEILDAIQLKIIENFSLNKERC